MLSASCCSPLIELSGVYRESMFCEYILLYRESMFCESILLYRESMFI